MDAKDTLDPVPEPSKAHYSIPCCHYERGHRHPAGGVHRGRGRRRSHGSLYWRRPNSLSLDRGPSIARITEHAALAIGNRRLMAALHGQATRDPRTGLANSRAFDLALEGSAGGADRS